MQSISGGDLFNRLYFSFGYLGQEGFAGKRYPVLISEVGSAFSTTADVRFMADFAQWLTAVNPAIGTSRRSISVRCSVPLVWTGDKGACQDVNGCI